VNLSHIKLIIAGYYYQAINSINFILPTSKLILGIMLSCNLLIRICKGFQGTFNLKMGYASINCSQLTGIEHAYMMEQV
jgi:hypothetical protein